MPVIGKFKTGGGRVDTRVTSGRVETRGVGAIPTALAKLGGDVTSAATEVGKVLHREEVLTYGDASKEKIDLFTSQEEERLKTKYAGTSHKGYAEDLKLSIDFERERLISEAPTRDAADYLKRDSQGSYDRAMANSKSYSLSESFSFSKGQDVELNNSLGQKSRNNPNIENVTADLNNRQQKIASHEGFRYNNAQTTALLLDAAKKSREGFLGGLEISSRFEDGLALLDDKENVLLQGMDQTERRKWENWHQT